MKTLFSVLTFAFLLTISSCSKDNDPTQSETPTAKAAYDNSNYGYYKGVFVGSTGIIVVNINNDNTLSAMFRVDGVTYNFTTTQTIQQGQPTTLNFTNGNNSFTFTVAANGASPTITNLIMNGHPDAAVLVVKETSTALVKCFEGTYTGGEHGIFNAVIYNNQIKALVRSITYQSDFEANGTVSNNQITATGSVSSGASFQGTLSGNNFSGNWSNTLVGLSGTWSGTRTY